jgi:hypothetical protein
MQDHDMDRRKSPAMRRKNDSCKRVTDLILNYWANHPTPPLKRDLSGIRAGARIV